MSWDLVLGFFPEEVQKLILDATISDLMINGTTGVFADRNGVVEQIPLACPLTTETLLAATQQIARKLGQNLSDQNPILNTRLPDGSRVAVVGPPASINGITMTIRKFNQWYTSDQLIASGSLSACVRDVVVKMLIERKNGIISGGTGSGKTTLMKAFLDHIPLKERLCIIEQPAELKVAHPNAVRWEAVEAIPGQVAITPSELLAAALRHRPDRIIMGEIRNECGYDLLQAMNTGHGGTLSTIHAKSAWDALNRLSNLALSARPNLNHAFMRSETAEAIDFVLYCERDHTGRRRVRELITVGGYSHADQSFQTEEVFQPCETTAMNTQTAHEFLTRCFHPGETIAFLLRGENPASTTQRIVRLEQAIAPRYLTWLRYENHKGANVYVAANPLRSGSRKRTKECIAEVRHLYLDIDVDGESRIAALMESEAVPAPTVILSTSPGKYQALWRVEGLDFERQENTLKLLAIAFGGDSACTDRNRVLRVPGFRNCKYDPAHPVTVEYPSDFTYSHDDFRLDDSLLGSERVAHGIARTYPTSKNTLSEQDWAWAVHHLSLGVDARELTETLAVRRSDKPNPLYYAQRTIDIASARLSLLEGAAIEDVIAMLEDRRSGEVPAALCSSRAREIATTAQRMIGRQKFTSLHTPKENHHATA